MPCYVSFRPFRLTVILIVLFGLAGCALTPRFANLEARVTSQQPLQLPRNAELNVTLRDSADNGGVVAEGNYTRLGSGPIPVVLRYDSNAIQSGRHYVLRAEISAGGKRLYTSPKPVAVLTDDTAISRVNIPVEPVNTP